MRTLCAAILLAGFCAKPPPPKSVEIEDVPPDPEGQVKKTLQDAYAAIEALEADRFEKLLTPDATGFGMGPSDFFKEQPSALEHLRQELLPFGLRGDGLKVVFSQPRVGIAESGMSAWVSDLPRVKWTKPGRSPGFWSVRVTLHLVKTGADKWLIDAFHVSQGFPDADLYAAGSEKKLVSPEDPGVFRGPDSDQLVGLTKRLLEDIAVKVDRVSDRDDVALIGTDATDVFEGGKKFKDLVKPQLAAIKKANTYTYKLEGGPRTKLGPGHKSGWLIATLTLTVGSGKKARTLVPFRALWVYAEEKGVWNLISDHQSLGLKLDQRTAIKEEDVPKAAPTEKAAKPAETSSVSHRASQPDGGS